MPETALSLVEGNFTYFFDIDSDGRDAQWLRTIFLFSEPPGDKTYENEMMDGTTATWETRRAPRPPPPPPLPVALRSQHTRRACASCWYRRRPLGLFLQRVAGPLQRCYEAGACAWLQCMDCA